MTRDEIVRWTNGIENVTNDTKFHKQLTINIVLIVFVSDRTSSRIRIVTVVC